MSKQFSFLATDADLRVIEYTLRQSGEVSLFSSETSDDDRRLRLLTELPIPTTKAGTVPLHCYLGPIDQPETIAIKRHSAVKTSVDIARSHLVEVRRPFYDGRLMRLGRFYYENRFVDEGSLVSKSVEFCEWADRVMNKVKRLMRHSRLVDAYVCDGAADAISSGQVIAAITDSTRVTKPLFPEKT